MSKNILKLGEYFGSVEVSLEDNCIYGEILFIEDTVIYESDKASEIQAAFEEAVTSYIDACSAVGRDPQKPFKGSFNVRIPKALHRQAAIGAKSLAISLNELVKRAIETFVGDSHIHLHHHDHHHETQTFNHIYEIPADVARLRGGTSQWVQKPMPMKMSQKQH